MTTHSPSIKELALGLAKAQPAMKAATMDCESSQFKNRYASLPSVMEAVRKPLADHGLCVVQGVGFRDGCVIVTTMLLHSSGEWIASELALPVGERATPQAIGSAITYGRRYGLAAMCGVVSDSDDDATAAEASANTSPVAVLRKTAIPAPAQTDEADEFEWRGKITDLTQKSDTNKRGPWTLTRVTVDGKTAGTFDKKLGDAAVALQKLGADVVVRVKPGKAGSYELLECTEDLPL